MGRWKGTAHTQEWQRNVVGLQNVLQVVQTTAEIALTDSAVTDSAVTEQLDEQIESLQDAVVQNTPS